MSVDRIPEQSEPVETLEELVAYFSNSAKSNGECLVGMEHEKVAVLEDTLGPVPYDGPRGIGALLRRTERLGYRPFRDLDTVIAAERDGQWISLEPGGQVELSGRPAATAREAAEEHLRHSGRMRAIGAELGIRFLGVGYRPYGRVDQMPWMPKRRYALMRQALAPRGRCAEAMMLMTGSVQASFDFVDEEDCADKVRTAASLVSLLTALFANSPLADGRRTGYQSYRARLWREVDPARCGLLPMYFDDEEGFRFRRYAEWALQVPMVLIRRRGAYVPMNGIPFARFLAEGYRGERATRVDWSDHLTLVFPEVRLKNVIELRSADACDVATSNALAALGQGVLYDAAAREASRALTGALAFRERLALQEHAAREGLRARIPRSPRTLREAGAELLAIAALGLERQGRAEDRRLLEPLLEIARSGRTRADRLIEAHATGDPRAVYDACALEPPLPPREPEAGTLSPDM